MKIDLNRIKKSCDLKSFGIGLLAVVIFYALAYLYVQVSATQTIQSLESQLSSQIAVIQKIEKTESAQHGDTLSSSTHHKKQAPAIEGLTEHATDGVLPVIRDDGMSSFVAYQNGFAFKDKITKPVIAFIIEDYGLSKENSEIALELLHKNISFLLSPFSSLPEEWNALAREKGHEVWMQAFFENSSIPLSDSGSATMMTRESYPQTQGKFHWTLSRADGYVGVAAASDEVFLQSKDQFKQIIEEGYARGLGYLELNPDAPPFVSMLALQNSAPYIKVDLRIIRATGKDSFEELEKIANDKGYAVALVPSYTENLKRLAVWTMKVAQSDYILVPVSAMYDLPLYMEENQGVSSTLSGTDKDMPHNESPH